MSTEAGIGLPEAAVPGVYPAAGGTTNLRYWNGNDWDPRPVAATWTRVWCNVVDNVIASFLWLIIGGLIIVPLAARSGTQGSESGGDPVASVLSIVTLIVVFVGYFAISYRLWGRTLGMAIGKLYVVPIPSGSERLSWKASIGRAMGLCLGYTCGIFTLIWLITTASSRTKQGPHDSWAHTCVLTSAGLGPVYPPVGRTPEASRDLTAPAPVTAVESIAATEAPPQDPASEQPESQDTQLQRQAAAAPRETAETSEPAVAQLPGATSVPAQERPTQDASPEQMAMTPASAAVPGLSRTRSRRRGLIIGVAVGGVLAILAVLAVAVVVDSRVRTSETEALLEATKQADEAIRDYWDDDGFYEAATELTRLQELTIATEQSNREAWQDFIDNVTAIAASHAGPVQESILDVEAVSILPWHTDVRQAQQAYVEHAEVWLEAVKDRSRYTYDARQVPDTLEGRDGELEATRAVVERRYEDISYLLMPNTLRQAIRNHFNLTWRPNYG